MTDDEEFAARSQLKWQRDGDVWICSTAVSVWAEWYLIRTIKACGVQSNQMA